MSCSFVLSRNKTLLLYLFGILNLVIIRRIHADLNIVLWLRIFVAQANDSLNVP